MAWYDKKWFRVLMRLIRVGGATGIAATLAAFFEDDRLLGIAPILVATFKYLRETYGGIWNNLPV